MHYEWQRLAEGVHRTRLPFLDVTVGLVVGDTGMLLIDCGTTLVEAAAIAEDVRELTGGDVTHLVMTHHHFDHILGSAGFVGALSYAAPQVAAALGDGREALCAEALRYGADADLVAASVDSVRPPDHLVAEPHWAVDINLGGRLAQVRHPGPGHTDHDLVVVIPGRPTVLFCGDLVEESADPAIGEDSDVAAWPAALEQVLTLGGDDAVYVPGHGAPVDAAFVAGQRDWLRSRC